MTSKKAVTTDGRVVIATFTYSSDARAIAAFERKRDPGAFHIYSARDKAWWVVAKPKRASRRK